MNNQNYYENTLLHLLYKIESVSTDIIEQLFNNVDSQLVNNVISNRNKSTSLILNGYMAYDEDNHILSITEKGKRDIEQRYQNNRR